jgi:ERCC4-related helicase
MPETETNREEELRRLLTDAIEVQLAALKAGISFWSEWIEQTSTFVTSATKTLSSINAEDQQAKNMLLELVDAGRASARAMTEIPRHTATRFLEELDRLEEKKKEAEKTAPTKKSAKKVVGRSAPASATAKKSSRRPRPKRAGRVKE